MALFQVVSDAVKMNRPVYLPSFFWGNLLLAMGKGMTSGLIMQVFTLVSNPAESGPERRNQSPLDNQSHTRSHGPWHVALESKSCSTSPVASAVKRLDILSL